MKGHQYQVQLIRNKQRPNTAVFSVLLISISIVILIRSTFPHTFRCSIASPSVVATVRNDVLLITREQLSLFSLWSIFIIWMTNGHLETLAEGGVVISCHPELSCWRGWTSSKGEVYCHIRVQVTAIILEKGFVLFIYNLAFPEPHFHET